MQVESTSRSPQPAVKDYILATRPMFISASLLPVLVGTAVAYHLNQNLDGLAFFLAMLAIAFAHAGINVFNDVYDELNGTDRINKEMISPFTGGSRFIQQGILDITQMRRWATQLVIMATILGAALALYKGLVVVVLGVLGIFIGIAYSAPPLKLVYRGLGESAVGIGFGVLPVTGAAWLQLGYFSWHALLISVPVSLWVANILLINEVPDAKADGQSGKNTLVVRFGNNVSAWIYQVANIVAVAILLAYIYLNAMPAWVTVVPLLSIIPSMYAMLSIRHRHKQPMQLVNGIKSTLMIHAINCLWLFGVMFFVV